VIRHRQDEQIDIPAAKLPVGPIQTQQPPLAKRKPLDDRGRNLGSCHRKCLEKPLNPSIMGRRFRAPTKSRRKLGKVDRSDSNQGKQKL